MVKFVDQYKNMKQASRLLVFWVCLTCLKNLPKEKFLLMNRIANQCKNIKMLSLCMLVLNSRHWHEKNDDDIFYTSKHTLKYIL